MEEDDCCECVSVCVYVCCLISGLEYYIMCERHEFFVHRQHERIGRHSIVFDV